MKRFLKETWELFYWALWCPSKLQQRMNDWVPQENSDTTFMDLLFYKFNCRFFSQFLLLIAILSLPLLFTGAPFFPIIILFILFTTYTVALFFLPLSLCVTALCWLVVSQSANDIGQGTLEYISRRIPSLYQLGLGVGVGSISLGITSAIVLTFLRRNQIQWSRNAFIIGSTLSVVLGVGLATENLLFTLFLGSITGFLSFLVKDLLESEDNVIKITIRVAGVVAVGVAVGVVGGVAGGVVVGVTTFPLLLFLLTAGLVAMCLSPAKNRCLGLTVTMLLIALGVENLGVKVLWVVPTTLLFYFRLVPDYLLLSLIIQLTSAFRRFSKNIPWLSINSALKQIQQLPPYSSELLWLSLPGHNQVLVAAFKENPTEALLTLKRMQAMGLHGFQSTVHQSLSPIVANLLAKIDTTDTLTDTISPDHPILSVLVPSFSTPSDDIEESNDFATTIVKGNIPTDLAIMVPRLGNIVKDVGNAKSAGNIALRERALERILNNLDRLWNQLPAQGIRSSAIPLWQKVLEQWRRVIELELIEQKKQSQGERLNPFLYGNPLKSESKNLFKGRQKFADKIVRQILDRNRPTLVLFGPRRMGKTSFLLNLTRLLPSDLIPIYIDLQRAGIQGVDNKEATQFEAAISQGILLVVDFESEEEAELSVNYAAVIDQGESTIGAIATDDKVAISFFREEAPHLQILSTLEIVKYWSELANLDGLTLKKVLDDIRIKERYVPHKSHPLRS